MTLGLATAYNDEKSEIGLWLHHFFGLIYLDPDDVDDSFTDDFIASQPDNEKCRAFADYLCENYIASDSLFPPQMWAFHTFDTTLTINARESFHSKFREYFYSGHPNIKMFVEASLACQLEVYVRIQSVGSPAKLRSDVKRQKAHLDNAIMKFKIHQDRFKFVKEVSYRFSTVKK